MSGENEAADGGASTEQFVQEMAAATPRVTDEGATASPSLKPATDVDDADELGDDATGQPQAATPADPWSAVKKYGSPEDIAQRLAQADEERENAKSMRRESHFRNEETRKREERLAMLESRVNEGYSATQSLIEAAKTAAMGENSELALQFLKMAGQQGGTGQGNPVAAAQGTPGGVPNAVSKQIEDLQNKFNQYAYGDGTSRVMAAALEAVDRLSIFKSPMLVKRGISDKVVQNIVQRVIQASQQDPTAVNVFDPRSVRGIVSKLAAEEAGFFDELKTAFVNDYRTERKALNGKSPPNGRGPTASVRSGTAPGSSPPANASQEQIQEFYVQQMAAATPRRLASET